MAVLTALSIAATARLNNRDIDNAVARGLDCEPDEDCESAWRTLLQNKLLRVFAAIAFAFHLANAAMLTSVSQQLARMLGKNLATSLTAACIVAAQLVMVPVALIAGRRADVWGTEPIFVVGFAFLPCAACATPCRAIRGGWWASRRSTVSVRASSVR